MSNNTFKVKNGLTLTPVSSSTLTNPQAGDIICDSSDNNKIKKYDPTTSSWTEVGAGGSSSLDTLFQLLGDDVAQWSTGDNATFLGGGTLSGTFVQNTTNPLQSTSDYLYTQAAGSLNDYLACAAQTVAPRFRGRDATLFFPYKYDGANNDIRVVFWDATAGVEIPSSVYIQASTTPGIFRTNITIPSTCTSIRIGFQTAVLNSGKIFQFDSIQLTADTTVMAPLYNQIQTMGFINTASVASSATWTGYTLSENKGPTLISFNSATGVYTVLRAGEITISFALANSSSTGATQGSIVKNASTVAIGNSVTGLGGGWGSSAVYTGTMEVGDTFYFRNSGSNTSGSAFLSILMKVPNQSLLSAPDTFSTDTAPLVYASSSQYTLTTLANAPVGTFITYTYAASSNTRTQTTTAPTQTTANMNQIGINIFTRNYASASTSTSPSTVAIQIGKGMKGVSVSVYKNSGKDIAGNLDLAIGGVDSVQFGAAFKDYNENTGVLFIDAGYCLSSAVTSNNIKFSDGASQNNGCFVINASKNPALTGLNIQSTGMFYYNSAGTALNNGPTTVPFPTKAFDTDSAFNGATGVYTIPSSGWYTVSSTILMGGGTAAAGTYVRSYVYINSSSEFLLGGETSAGTAVNWTISGSTNYYFTKGDTVAIRVRTNTAATQTMSTGTGDCWLSIVKNSVG